VSIIIWLVVGLITGWGAGKAPGPILSNRDMPSLQLAWHCLEVQRAMGIEPIWEFGQINILAASR